MTINIIGYEDMFGHRIYSLANTNSSVKLSEKISSSNYSFLSTNTVRIKDNIDSRRGLNTLSIQFDIDDWINEPNLSLYLVASTTENVNRSYISIPVRFNNKQCYLTATNIKDSKCFTLQLSERANGSKSSNMYINSPMKFKQTNTLDIQYSEYFDLMLDSIIVSPYKSNDTEYANINNLYFLDDLERINSELPHQTNKTINQVYDYSNLGINYKTESDYMYIEDGVDQYKLKNIIAFMDETIEILSYLRVKVILNCEDNILNHLNRYLMFTPLYYSGNSMYTTRYISTPSKIGLTDQMVASYTHKYIEPLFTDKSKRVTVDLGEDWKESFRNMDGLNILDRIEIDFRLEL